LERLGLAGCNLDNGSVNFLSDRISETRICHLSLNNNTNLSDESIEKIFTIIQQNKPDMNVFVENTKASLKLYQSLLKSSMIVKHPSSSKLKQYCEKI